MLSKASVVVCDGNKYLQEFEKLREAHSELQLLYREKSRELEQLSVTLTSHSTTYQALQAQVCHLVMYIMVAINWL